MRSYIDAWRRYADFSGRTSRKDFWTAWLVYICFGIPYLSFVSFIAYFLLAQQLVNPDALDSLLSFLVSIRTMAFIIPGIALNVRRLRDAGYGPKSFFWLLLPGIGMIAFVARLCMKSAQVETTAE